jgi:hypothetical protein
MRAAWKTLSDYERSILKVQAFVAVLMILQEVTEHFFR